MKVSLAIDIAVSPAEVAELLLDFGALPRWHPGVEGFDLSGRGPGAVRSYRLAGAQYRERLDSIAHDGLTYTVLDGPLPLFDARGTYTIRPGAGEGTSRVSWSVSFDGDEHVVSALGEAAIALEEASLALLKATLEEGADLRPRR